MRRERAWGVHESILLCAVTCACAGAVMAPRVARAQTEAPTSDGHRLFVSGSEHFLAKRYAEALEDLTKSHEVLPSPNSSLLIARCLRELGRPVAALEQFKSAESEARTRVSQGDAKYLKSAEAAAAEAKDLRATLGTLYVNVRNAPDGTSVEVAGRTYPVDHAPLSIVVEPGPVTVRVSRGDGGTQSSLMTVAAGSEARLELDLHGGGAAASTPPEPAAEVHPAKSGRPWAIPAALVSAGIGVAGISSFIGFGLASQNIYDDLDERCGVLRCTSEHRADANRGETFQTIANVGLVVGAVGAASAITFFVLAATSTSSRGSANQGQLRYRIVPTPFGVSGVF